MKRGLLPLALLVGTLLMWAWVLLRVPSIEPTRPFATCEDRAAWVR